MEPTPTDLFPETAPKPSDEPQWLQDARRRDASHPADLDATPAVTERRQLLRLVDELRAKTATPAPSPASVVVLSEADKLTIEGEDVFSLIRGIPTPAQMKEIETQLAAAGCIPLVAKLLRDVDDLSTAYSHSYEDRKALLTLYSTDEWPMSLSEAMMRTANAEAKWQKAESQSAALREELASVRQEVAGIKASGLLMEEGDGGRSALASLRDYFAENGDSSARYRIEALAIDLGFGDIVPDGSTAWDLPAVLPQLGDIAEEGGQDAAG